MSHPDNRPEDALLTVRNLTKHFPTRTAVRGMRSGVIRAVDGVSFDIPRGAAMGLVGESGCGKTTAGRTILRLLEPTAGDIRFAGEDLRACSTARLRSLRRDMQIVFQDSTGSLDPRMTVGRSIAEPMAVHGMERGRARRMRVAELLERVGLRPEHVERFPHELSGGQRQRIGIARALASRPSFVVCDEPVSALDVSVQAQIINLLKDLQAEFGLTYLFIAHNLAVVRHFCKTVAIMYLGKIVEMGAAEDVFHSPRHPYTKALLDAVPNPDPGVRGRLAVLPGEMPLSSPPPSGCPFQSHCPFVQERCHFEAPELESRRDLASGHVVACHRAVESLLLYPSADRIGTVP